MWISCVLFLHTRVILGCRAGVTRGVVMNCAVVGGCLHRPSENLVVHNFIHRLWITEGKRSPQVASDRPRPQPCAELPYLGDHYSLLRTIEQNWNLGFLGNASDGQQVKMLNIPGEPKLIKHEARSVSAACIGNRHAAVLIRKTSTAPLRIASGGSGDGGGLAASGNWHFPPDNVG